MPVAARKDSQEVCFVPDRNHLPFVSLDGKAIGRYSDYEKHTVGQRKCLRTRFGERFFVQRIIELHSVVLGPYEELDVDRIRAIDSI